jgi:hypothetical protein
MSEINITKYKLTTLQEDILIQINKTSDYQFVCKKLDIKPITLTKALQTLKLKGLLDDNSITKEGQELINYYSFRNETSLMLLKYANLNHDKEMMEQISKLDFKLIIAIRNLLNN